MKKQAALLFVAIVLLTASCNLLSESITILHLNDSHSNLLAGAPRRDDLSCTYGGLARAVDYIAKEKKANPNTLLFHAGDFYTGDLFFNIFFGVPELRILAQIGCDAIVPGNHEFDLGPAALLKTLDSGFAYGRIPVLAANLIAEDSSVSRLKDYVSSSIIKQYGDVRVGVFGLTTPETNTSPLLAPVAIGDSLAETARICVESLKKDSCDVVILLSHLGESVDRQIASSVPGIDIIVGGHDHIYRTEPIEVPNGGKTVRIVQAGAFYKAIGRIGIEVEGGSVTGFDYRLVPLEESMAEDSSVDAGLSVLKAQIEALFPGIYTRKIAVAGADFYEIADSLAFPGHHDTPAGNLVTDAFRAFTGTDIAITCGGLTAQPLFKGPVVPADVFRMIGYGFNADNGLGYRLYTFTISGVYLWAILEYLVSNTSMPLNDEYLVQCSGMKYEYYVDYKPGLKSVTIGGTPLNTGSKYSVTVNEFIYYFLQNLNIPLENVLMVSKDNTESQVVAGYLNLMANVSPVVEGRVEGVLKSNAVVGTDESLNTLVYPNPVTGNSDLHIIADGCGLLSVELYDLTGRLVKNMVAGAVSDDEHKVTIATEGLGNGAYCLIIRSREGVRAYMLSVCR